MRPLKNILASLVRILLGVPIVSLIVCGLLFLVLAETLRGRSVGLSAAILGVVLFCSVGYWRRDWFKRLRRWFYGVLLPTGLLLYLVPMILAPSGGKPDGLVRNCFLGGRGAFPRYSPWNVIPEIDQIKIGTTLMPLGGREMGCGEAARLRSLLLPIYAAIEKDAEFRELGSVMGMAYRDLFHLGCRADHYCVFLPAVGDQQKNGDRHRGEGASAAAESARATEPVSVFLPDENVSGTPRVPSGGRQRFACLVFLHGLGGNVKPCLWLLARLAKTGKCVVIAPTFGMGDWDKPGGAQMVVDVVQEAVATLPVDPKRILLMGYSNGAMGVTRAAIKRPGLFQGLIYLSPVTEDELFSTPQFLARARDRKILFLHGGRDPRIPKNVVEGTVALLKSRRCKVRLKIYPDEDHWLLFSRPEAVLGDVVGCMNSD
jgi:predicted esterase